MTCNSRYQVRATLLLLGLAGTLGGCVSQTPIVDRHFGEAVVAARAQQTINPKAGQAAPAAVGLDGRAGKSALDRYHDSFKEPPQTTNVMRIGVGGSSE